MDGACFNLLAITSWNFKLSNFD